VLREGNSDRRVAAPVKAHAAAHPHKLKPWPKGSRTHVAHMQDRDFFSGEQSTTLTAPATVLHIKASFYALFCFSDTLLFFSVRILCF
jgi:isocitrate dehydrogenase